VQAEHHSNAAAQPGSLTDILSHRARTIGNNCAYVYVPPRTTTPLELTYTGLFERATAIAARLIEQGLSGGKVLLLYPPGLEFIEAFYGCMYANVSTVPMYVPVRSVPDARLRAIAETVDIAAILTVEAKAMLVAGVADQLFADRPRPILLTDKIEAGPRDGWDLATDHDVAPLIQFTSGSTSRPKGVIVTHGNIMANQGMIQRSFGHRGGETVVGWLPFFHDMGLIGNIMQPLFIGGCSVLMSSADFLQFPNKWLHLVSLFGAETSGAPNFAYEYCVSRITDEQIDELDLSGWKVAYNGAEMIRPATMKRFSERFARTGFRPESVLNCYGMAETTLYVTAGPCFRDGLPTPASGAPALIASVGSPDPESVVRVVGADAREVAERSVGEVWVRGPHVAAGYVNNPAATKETFQARVEGEAETYLRTGDLGFMADGELHIVGRLKNLIVLNGRNYHGEEIEYFGACSDDRFLESGACLVQVNEGLSENEIIFMQEIKKSCFDEARRDPKPLEEKAVLLSRQILSEFSLPVHRIIYLRENRLPRTSSGKIDRGRAPTFAQSDPAGILMEVKTR
jgi:acyl-CoA synthetase (AMP-forming)/AMP-acid ligase II